MAAHFQLRCLGEPGLFTIGGRPVKLRTRKQLALLCFLAMEARYHTRDALAELLWPKAPQGEARHSLATAMSGLRGKLGKEVFEATSDRIRLRPGAIVLDVDRLLRGEVLGSDVETPLDVDGFLQSFEVPDAPPFSHWRDAEHARLLPNVRDALVILIDRCRRTGDFRQIERLAIRLVRFEPLSEEAARARMEARALAGDRLSALRIFKEWKQALQVQLGAMPSPLLEGMAIRLRQREWERPEFPEIPAVRTDQWRGRPFVGRGREYRELYEAWEGTQRGAARHRLLLGDSGVGKSTLVERLTTAAGLEGAMVARVQCHEVEREIPYTAVSGLIAQLVERPGASAAPPDDLAELAQTIPAVRQRFPVLPAPLESQGDAARIRFTEAAYALMAAVAEEHPVIMVVDDVHHADDVSLAVLHRVVRLAESKPILVLFVARPGELHQSPQAARLRDNGPSLGIHPLDIGPLDLDDGRSLLDLLVAELELSPSISVRRALISAAAGFPLVLELLVRDWARSGEQCLALSLDAVTQDACRRNEPDEAYQLLLDRLARSLDAGTHNTLHVAAVLGPRLNDSSLYQLADLRIAEVMSGLTTLVQYRILRDAGDHLEFANDLVRAHAYFGVPAPMRMLLHERIADAFLARAATGDDSLGLEIAWHCMRCGRKEEATTHLLSGARAAIRRGAVHEAERRIGSGLSSLSGEALKEGRLLLVELLQEQGRWSESSTLLATFGEERSSAGGLCLDTEARIHISGVSTSERIAAKELAASCISDQHLDNQTRLRALRLAGTIAANTENKQLAEDFLCIANSSDVSGWLEDERLEWETQIVYLTHFTHDRISQSEETCQRLERLATLTEARIRPNARSYRILAGLAVCHRRAGRYDEAIQAYHDACTIATQLDRRVSIARVTGALSACYRDMGHLELQYQYGLRAIEFGVADLRPIDHFPIHTTFCAFEAAHLLGERQAADEIFARLNAYETHQLSGHSGQMFLIAKADALWIQERPEAALVVGDRAVRGYADGLVSRCNVSGVARWLAVLAHNGRWNPEYQPILEKVLGMEGVSWWDETERLTSILRLGCAEGGSARIEDRRMHASNHLPMSCQPYLIRYGLASRH